jgi:hypothetical protein
MFNAFGIDKNNTTIIKIHGKICNKNVRSQVKTIRVTTHATVELHTLAT